MQHAGFNFASLQDEKFNLSLMQNKRFAFISIKEKKMRDSILASIQNTEFRLDAR